MSTTNVYFSQGTKNEQHLIEDIIIESLKIYGNEIFYIPRSLVSKDNVLGEDRLSQFKTAFPIEMYFENVDSFGGQGAFIQKFGLMIEQSATLVVARRRWEQLVGRYGQSQIPSRPNEGDLIYFPLTGSLFELKFVQHQDPFYQLGKLYVYKLQVELYQYSSERIDTGIAEIDTFESLKTFSTNTTRNIHGRVATITMTNSGTGYTSVPTVTLISSTGIGATATAIRGTSGANLNKITGITITNAGTRYQTAPVVSFTGGGGTGAAATTTLDIDIKKSSDGFGENDSFKDAATGVINFDDQNPFGEINNA